MSTEALRAAVESEGRDRVAGILRAAEQEAKELRDAAAARARQRQRDALRGEETTLRRQARVRTLAARTAARRRVLESREELLDRIFARAEQQLCHALEGPAARRETLARLERAFSYVRPEEEVRVVASSGVAPWLEEALADRPGVRVECDPELPAGFRMVASGGSVAVDATLAKLLEKDRPALAIEVLARLERESEEGR